MDELFREACDWKNGKCRNARDKGPEYACCSRLVCPSLCPLGKIFPNRCKSVPPICKYYLCNVAKIYIMEHPHLHAAYLEMLKEADKMGIEYNSIGG